MKLEIKILHWIFSRYHVDHKTVPVTHGIGKTLWRSKRLCKVSPRAPYVPEAGARYEVVAHGNVHHVHMRPSRELPLDRGIDYDQSQLP